MEQRVSIVTLGVKDIGRSRRFYEQLGWRGQELEETVFFQAGGQAVVLWGREKLAADSGVADDGSTFGGIALAHNVRSSLKERSLSSAAPALAGTFWMLIGHRDGSWAWVRARRSSPRSPAG